MKSIIFNINFLLIRIQIAKSFTGISNLQIEKYFYLEYNINLIFFFLYITKLKIVYLFLFWKNKLWYFFPLKNIFEINHKFISFFVFFIYNSNFRILVFWCPTFMLELLKKRKYISNITPKSHVSLYRWLERLLLFSRLVGNYWTGGSEHGLKVWYIRNVFFYVYFQHKILIS